mmetsp:Transcript_1823/g.5094  ORF Transcript_1823/g.5094 Transcript_1823/m.5094 type:complete len:290 (-) Transcript_1823:416-1285(-)
MRQSGAEHSHLSHEIHMDFVDDHHVHHIMGVLDAINNVREPLVWRLIVWSLRIVVESHEGDATFLRQCACCIRLPLEVNPHHTRFGHNWRSWFHNFLNCSGFFHRRCFLHLWFGSFGRYISWQGRPRTPWNRDPWNIGSLANLVVEGRRELLQFDNYKLHTRSVTSSRCALIHAQAKPKKVGPIRLKNRQNLCRFLVKRGAARGCGELCEAFEEGLESSCRVVQHGTERVVRKLPVELRHVRHTRLQQSYDVGALVAPHIRWIYTLIFVRSVSRSLLHWSASNWCWNVQ